ncbi:MAG: histidinol phosphate phosphatase, partial [Lachnospiraceae bacterium]|nr:histidinol phosphate phosphatase [Lachnospiraceae bacterium]
GLAHPDSIKCFGYKPDVDLTEYYNKLAKLLNKHGMYAENSGGLRLNYSPDLELGLNPQLLSVLRKNNVRIETASDAHKQSDVGANSRELEGMLKAGL